MKPRSAAGPENIFTGAGAVEAPKAPKVEAPKVEAPKVKATKVKATKASKKS